jgi:hypothetical protein
MVTRTVARRRAFFARLFRVLWQEFPMRMFLRLMAEQFKLEKQLIQDKEAFQRYMQAKLYVAEEVIAGRLSVTEALEAFRRLAGQRLPNSTKQDMLERWKVSEDEWLGMGVLYYVEQFLVEATTVVARVKKRSSGNPVLGG